MLTEASGPVEIEVPRDRAGTFEPQIVKKRQRRLGGVDQVVLSLYAKGLTTGEISAHFEEIYGASVSKETISRITDRVLDEMQDWATRPLDAIYAAVFVDAIVVKVRDGQVTNRPFYAAIGVTLDGERDILGLWAGQGGEGAKFWMSVLTDLRNRGVRDVFFLVCDGLKGLPEVVSNVWPETIVQTCLVHLLRNTYRLASKRDWDALKKHVTPIYTAVNAAAARAAFDELVEYWGQRYPAVVRLWDNAWDAFIPFLDYDIEVRRVLATGDPLAGPNRARPGTMDDAVEARDQRVLYHLRRPPPASRDLLMGTAGKHRSCDRPTVSGDGNAGWPRGPSVSCVNLLAQFDLGMRVMTVPLRWRSCRRLERAPLVLDARVGAG